MTREEAIEVIKDIYNYTKWDTYTTNEARTMAIKALEQQPCEDCISRDMALKESYRVNIDGDYGDLFDVVQVETLIGLPSVTPQRKEAYWIEESDNEYTTIYCYRCSNCGNCNEDDTDYCPDCGCLMTDVRGDEG